MPRLIWTPPALADVQRLYRFLAPKDKDEAAARRAIKVIRAGVKILAHQPEVGRPADNMDPAFREWLIEFGSSGYRYRHSCMFLAGVQRPNPLPCFS